MRRFTMTFVRSLAILTITTTVPLALVGCDEADVEELEDVENDDEDPRDLPMASIPFDDLGPAKLPFTIPMQSVARFTPKLTFALHFATDTSYVPTPDPTGADALLTDLNGVSPYSQNLTPVEEDVCDEFHTFHPYYVPVTDSVEACAEVEHGCCDRICYLWGGWAIESNGQNVVSAVTDTTMSYGMVYGTYVTQVNPRMTWSLGVPYGGHSAREKVCACNCEMEVVDED